MGYIGQSKNLSLTFLLTTKLLGKSEVRGIDATGYWGTESGILGSVIYNKEPIRSSLFVQKEVWTQINQYNIDLLLTHARGASKGVGEPQINSNNHPFVNSDKSIALIHNGRIDDVEYKALQQKYTLKTTCDSEILLRIFETFDQDDLLGIKEIFSLINEGHMAVAVGKRGLDGSRTLWLFRNQYRPIWIVDLRDILGQIFFISEPSIWAEVIANCLEIREQIINQSLIEFPSEEIWHFKLDAEELTPKNPTRYKVSKDQLIPWSFDGIKSNIIEKNPSFNIVTNS